MNLSDKKKILPTIFTQSDQRENPVLLIFIGHESDYETPITNGEDIEVVWISPGVNE